MLADVRPIVNLPVFLARQIHRYLVESQLIVLQQRHEEMERMMQEGMYIFTSLTEDDLCVVSWIVTDVLDGPVFSISDCRKVTVQP
jgi:hypothetical protein